MIRIHCEAGALRTLTRRHLDAVRGYIELQDISYQEALYAAVSALTALPPPQHPDFASARAAKDWSWLEHLILADVSTLRRLAVRDKPRLQFKQFADMYGSRFSRTPETYLYDDYNAYSLIEGLGLHICPYCDEEPAEAFEADGKKRRNAQLDHFFPKSAYSGLAMCFYNLIPSGTCNQVRLEKQLGMNPYEEGIEDHTRLFPDIAIGVNLAALTPKDCVIKFHATAGMEENVRVLGLEKRYEKHQKEAYRLLRNIQFYSEAKRKELARDFFAGNAAALREALGLELPTEQDWREHPLAKLRHDILSTAMGVDGPKEEMEHDE